MGEIASGRRAMNAAERLHAEYQRKLKHLQETCPHEKLTDWKEEWWAPGHPTGRLVRSCANCNKIVKTKRTCDVCRKEFPESELKEGDGHLLPLNRRYCPGCYPEARHKAMQVQAEFGPPHGTVAAPLDVEIGD